MKSKDIMVVFNLLIKMLLKINSLLKLLAHFCKIEKIDEVDHRPFGPKQTPATESVHLFTSL